MEQGVPRLGWVRSHVPTPPKTRRSWSDREEEDLLRCLKEIAAQGWKSKISFRAGYLNRLESMMSKAFPGMDLKAIPHINSKVHIWKDYGSLVTMITKSGIGFYHGTNMIKATDEAWNQHINVDATARLMRFKACPMFNDWLEVFGKDRAAGEAADDITEAAAEIQIESNGNDKGKTVVEDLPAGEDNEQVGKSTSVFSASVGNSEKVGFGKKSKISDEGASIVEVLGKFLVSTEQRLSKLLRE